jgi:hypothetical protein
VAQIRANGYDIRATCYRLSLREFICSVEDKPMKQKRSAPRVPLFLIFAANLLIAVSGWGQATIMAQITGGGGNGKCTFEVRVDGVADVQIRGNQGFLQTKAGMPAQWVRLKCNQPLPRNPNNFRFAGVDGRGKQYLLRNPAQNNGVAVVRIEDPKSGFEGYTGDIMWNGGNNNGGNNSGGWWNDNWNGGGGWGPPPGGNPGWNNNLVPNCQNNIRNKVRQQIHNAQVNFIGQPSRNQAGSFVMVDGTASIRDNQGRMGQISYHCSMHPTGNVADANFNVTQGPGIAQPR